MDRRQILAALAALPVAQACASAKPLRARRPELSIRLNDEAVPAMIAAYGRTSITDLDLDTLLALRGVQAAVDNTTRFAPESDRAAFRTSLRQWVETRNPTVGRFGLRSSAANTAAAKAAREALMLGRDGLQRELVDTLAPYWPVSSPLEVTVYLVMAGASDGFILDDDRPEAFVAIDRSQGDPLGVQVNMTHELFHVGQKLARNRVPGLSERVGDRATTSAPIRLLTSVLDEGTANYVADPTRMTGNGPYFAMWRERFVRNAAPDRLAGNFALFDQIARRLVTGSATWDQAYAEGFSGSNDAKLYFVGYQMAKTLDSAAGPNTIIGAFGCHPAAFFQSYVASSRAGNGPRFSPETENWLLTLDPA